MGIYDFEVTDPGRILHNRFLSLGDMAGKSAAEIIKAVGQPSSISSLGENTLLQWQSTGCHMALLFDDKEQFIKIMHQYAHLPPPYKFRSYTPEPEGHPVRTTIGIILGLLVGISILVAQCN